MAGGFVAGHQPLVAVHQWIGDGTASPYVSQQSRDELIGQRGQVPGIRLVIEGIFPIPKQGHIYVHAAAGGAADGLGHEGGVEAVLLGQSLHRQLEGHDVVRSPQGVGVLEVDLVLAGCHLVVAGLHRHAHLLQIQADLPAGPLPMVQRAQGKIAGLVGSPDGGLTVFIGLEQKELQFRSHIAGEAQGVGTAEHPLQHTSGITGEGGTIGVVDVADQPGHLAVLGPPGQDGKGVQVRPEILV